MKHMKRNYSRRLKYGRRRTHKKGKPVASPRSQFVQFGGKMRKAHRAWKHRDESALHEDRPGWLSGPKRISNPRGGRRRRKARRKATRSYRDTFYSGPARRRNPKRKKARRRNPLPRWVHKKSVRTIFRGKGKKRRRLLVGCPKGSWRRGRCSKGMRLVEKKRA